MNQYINYNTTLDLSHRDDSFRMRVWHYTAVFLKYANIIISIILVGIVICEEKSTPTCNTAYPLLCVFILACIHLIRAISYDKDHMHDPDYCRTHTLIWAGLHAIIGIWPMYCYFMTSTECMEEFQGHFIWYAILFESSIAVVSLILVLVYGLYMLLSTFCNQDNETHSLLP